MGGKNTWVYSWTSIPFGLRLERKKNVFPLKIKKSAGNLISFESRSIGVMIRYQFVTICSKSPNCGTFYVSRKREFANSRTEMKPSSRIQKAQTIRVPCRHSIILQRSLNITFVVAMDVAKPMAGVRMTLLAQIDRTKGAEDRRWTDLRKRNLKRKK